eukprot:jgi/Psemu1/288645/fgenesh1_pg.281_\
MVQQQQQQQQQHRLPMSRSNNNTTQNQSSRDAAMRDASMAIEGYVPSSGSQLVPVPAAAVAVAAAAINEHETKNETDNNNNDYDNENTNRDDVDDESPLVIDSLEGLMRAAGEPLPDHPDKITGDSKLVEANISFSVMTKDQYERDLPDLKQHQEEEQKRHLDVVLGKRNVFGDDESEDERVKGALGDDDSDDDDDAVMELLLASDVDETDDDHENDDDNNNNKEPEVRAFTLLWSALTNWMTHDTVEWVKTLRETQGTQTTPTTAEKGGAATSAGATVAEHTTTTATTHSDTEWTPMVDRSDVGASRCAGVSAMLRLYLGRCLDELHHPTESRRRAEKRLNDVLRTFDYSRENPKLSARHWRAMACVLLDMVMVEARGVSGTGTGTESSLDVPPSIAGVGMTKIEFEYLSRKAVPTFE